MINAIFYTIIGIPTGYVMSIFTNDVYKMIYNRNISNNARYSIITTITFLAFLRGYTGNDLITNIYRI
jgi:hypothetical protein